MSPATASTVINAFPGLRPFREDEVHLFFGRERQTDRMLDRLRPSRFLAIVGTSGSGKSSMVNCGLRPALYRGLMAETGTAWRFAQSRPANKPIWALAQALAVPGVLFSPKAGDDPDELMLDQIIDATLRISALGLVDIYQQAYPAGNVNLLVVIDQFEELFRYRKLTGGNEADRYGLSEESIAFVKLLLEASAQREYPIYVAITMRSDFLGDCAQIDGLPEAINEGQYLVPRMSRAERRTAIEGPVAVGGKRISPVLLTRLVNDVGDNPDQLSILQHALNRTAARAARDVEAAGELSPGHYEDIGSMAHALDRHADKAWDELTTPRQREICEKVFRALTDTSTDPRGIRRPARLSSLCALADATQDEVIQVLAPFRKASRSFLLPPLPLPPARDDLSPDTVVDISHESLMRVWEKLKGWAEKESRAARLYRRVSETALLYKEGKAGLIRDRELETLLTLWKRERPNAAWAAQYAGDWESVELFVEVSKKAHYRELAEAELEKRWRNVWRPLAIGAAVAVGIYPLFASVKQVLAELYGAQKGHDVSQAGLASIPWSVVFWPVIKLSFFFTVLVTGMIGVLWASRIVFRKVAFDGILDQVATRAEAIEADETVTEAADALSEAPHVYAVWWRRLLSWIVDFIVFIVMEVMLAFAMEIVVVVLKSVVPSIPDSGALLEISVLPLLVDWLYEALMTSSRWQATLGMRLLGIVVTDMGGKRVSFARASAWHFARILCWLTFLIGFAVQLFTPKKQGLQDLIARVLVVPRTRQEAVGSA
jgi:uncharacterized RDD family membrane protein YckC